MFQNFKTMTVVAATLAFTGGGLTSAFAETSTSRVNSVFAAGAGSGASKKADKTSDRTPSDKTPHRTPDATAAGAAGTDVGKTAEGTSDRTPSNHYNPASN